MDKKDNISKFPITYSKRRKNMLGPLHVECQISGRFLKFDKHSSVLQGGEFIHVDVMAIRVENDKETKKLCELVVTREDLLEALSHVTPNTDTDS